MADKRNGSDRACRCRQAHVDCVGVVVQRLGQERVLELAEEIWTASGADLFRRQRGDNRTSASARVWRRQAVLQRRTAGALGSLTRDGYLVLHDVSLPGWPASLDHLVVGSTGVWVIHSWRRPWFARPRRTSSPESSRGGFALRPLGPRVEAEVVGQVLTATGARLHIQPLVCVHGDGTRVQQGQADRVIARLLEVLGPAA